MWKNAHLEAKKDGKRENRIIRSSTVISTISGDSLASLPFSKPAQLLSRLLPATQASTRPAPTFPYSTSAMKLFFATALLASSALAATSASAAVNDATTEQQNSGDLFTSPYAVDAAIEQSIVDSLHELVYDPNVVQLLDPPKGFELYVLAQSWQPEFCHGKEKVYPGCKSPQPYWRQHFTMHGLWPERESGAPPGFCGGEPFDIDQIEKEIGLDALKEFWPDVKFSEDSPQYPDFWKHEWTRHGTCSGLPQVEYFSYAINMIRNGTAETPAFVQENVGKKVAITDLRSAFGGSSSRSSKPAAVLKCMHGGDTLSQVFTCWSKDAKNVPIARRECPAHVLEEDTCSRSTIQIPAFSPGL